MGPDLVLPPGIPITGQRRGYCDAKLKRLERGTFRFPVSCEKALSIDRAELMRLLRGLEIVR